MDKLREAAPYLSILGLVVLASVLFLNTAGASTPDWFAPLLAGGGVVLLLAWPVLRFDDLRAAAQGRQARHGGNAALLVISVLGILAAVYYLGTFWYWTWDVTENKQFTVSRATVQILDDIDTPVTLTSVLDTQASAQQVADLERLMEQYTRESDLVTYSNIDPVADSVALQALAAEVDQSPAALSRALVAQSAGGDATVYAFDEQAVTEAVVKATRDRDLTVWFTTGHDENSLDTNYTTVRQGLEDQGYTVEVTNLATLTETLSTDSVQAVVVAGPRQPFRPAEVDVLADYVAAGGSVMLLLDPLLDGTELGLEPVTEPFEIRPRSDLVIDPANTVLGGAIDEILIRARDLRFHAITRDLMDLEQIVALPSNRSIDAGTPTTSTIRTTVLAETSEDAWGETDFASLVPPGAGTPQPPAPAPSEGEATGPLGLAVAGEDDDGGRIVVFGTSSFVTDNYLRLPSLNGPLFSNALNWLTQEEDLITIPATPPDERPLQPPTNPTLLLASAALLMPLAVLGVGAWFWWRRR